MIAKVMTARGSSARGLLEYLWGPGKANEHVAPRTIAAWQPDLVRDTHAPLLDLDERAHLAREMEAPLRLHGLKPGAHVYHVAVSIEAEQGELIDEQWREVATEAATKLGFTETASRSPVPWIAMRHGPAQGGTDHIHFVAVLCRESGERITPWGDWSVWEEVRHNAEQRWGLRPTRCGGGGLPGITRGELEMARRDRRPEPGRVRLARTVRAAAGAARNEAEFVARVRSAGLRIRPRWAKGGHSAVVGYSVAEPPASGASLRWFGGSSLAEDLTLPQLRRQWPEPTIDVAADVQRSWRPPGWRRLPTGTQIVRRRLRSDAWKAAADHTATARARLAHLSPDDVAGWAAVSRQTAAVLASLADRGDVDHRGELRRAATALARVAQSDRGALVAATGPDVRPLVGVVRTASDALLASYGGPYGVAMLVIQVGRLVQKIEEAHDAGGRAAQAFHTSRAAQAMLDFIHHGPPTRPAAGQAERASAAGPDRRPEAVLPRTTPPIERGKPVLVVTGEPSTLEWTPLGERPHQLATTSRQEVRRDGRER